MAWDCHRDVTRRQFLFIVVSDQAEILRVCRGLFGIDKQDNQRNGKATLLVPYEVDSCTNVISEEGKRRDHFFLEIYDFAGHSIIPL